MIVQQHSMLLTTLIPQILPCTNFKQCPTRVSRCKGVKLYGVWEVISHIHGGVYEPSSGFRLCVPPASVLFVAPANSHRLTRNDSCSVDTLYPNHRCVPRQKLVNLKKSLQLSAPSKTAPNLINPDPPY